MDLVGALELPSLRGEAQGLRVRRDRPLVDVLLDRAGILEMLGPHRLSGPGRGPFKAVARVRIPLGASLDAAIEEYGRSAPCVTARSSLPRAPRRPTSRADRRETKATARR